MLIRGANADDWQAVASLLAELGRPDVLGTDEEADAREVFRSYVRRPDVVTLVAEENGRVVGFLDMEYRARLNFIAPQAWIPDLIVEEKARSLGIGHALLERAEELARDRGCWGMSLESATWRDRAHAFYVREGWQDTGRAFTKVFGGVTWPPAPR